MFRAYESDRDRLGAVKLFRLDLPPEGVHQLAAELERRIVAERPHPRIAAPVAAGIEGTSAYLAQEHAAANSLAVGIGDWGPTPREGRGST